MVWTDATNWRGCWERKQPYSQCILTLKKKKVSLSSVCWTYLESFSQIIFTISEDLLQCVIYCFAYVRKFWSLFLPEKFLCYHAVENGLGSRWLLSQD